MRLLIVKLLAVIFLLMALLAPSKGFSLCKPKILNPITDICWECIFPIRIGGIAVFSTDEPDAEKISSPICVCYGPGNIPVIGLTVSFWEPFRIIEVVADPWCLVTEGVNVDAGLSKTRRGVVKPYLHNNPAPHFFAQAHYIIFPAWAVLDLFKDIPCIDHGEWDIAYLTELDPLWQNDIQSLILNPEALVFGNALLQIACSADAVASAFGLPRDELFWCMGQWGGVYPLTGRAMTQNPVLGAAAVAGKLLFKLHREHLICDRAISQCGCVRPPIWAKSHFRLQVLRPKAVTGGSIRIGEPAPLWSAKLAPPTAEGVDNFSFMIFRKVNCCLFYKP